MEQTDSAVLDSNDQHDLQASSGDRLQIVTSNHVEYDLLEENRDLHLVSRVRYCQIQKVPGECDRRCYDVENCLVTEAPCVKAHVCHPTNDEDVADPAYHPATFHVVRLSPASNDYHEQYLSLIHI